MENWDLATINNRIWFYEFEMPDGTFTRTDVPSEVLHIHKSRREKLRRVIRDNVGDAKGLTALDIASHEGYFSIELAHHFAAVHGIEIRPESLNAAKQISRVLGVSNVRFTQADFTQMPYDPSMEADFVLIYGLLYHLENPIHALRLASQLTRKHILIETQLFPYDIAGRVEDGYYLTQREVHGVFSMSLDYPKGREGGSTTIALVPSLNALLFLLKEFGFRSVQVLNPDPDDYEQFRRRSRVVVYGSK
jgi:ubiquinone/menaquinone biosynthesis C-methylase UbiE